MATPLSAYGAVESEHLMTRVIWYYFVAGMTQQQIADKLGITRLRTNRIIGTARANSLVRIELRMPLAGCVALEVELKRRYGLREAKVVPSVDEEQDPQRIIGQAAASLVEPLLTDGTGFGLGWGRTLSSLVRGLAPRRLADAWTVTLMGSLTHGSGVNTFEVSTRFADLMGTDCHYVAAPIYCPSSESRTTLMTHEGLAEAMRRASLVDVALLSCGDLSAKSLLARTQTVSECVAALREAGAVGDLLGVFLDADGAPVDHPLNTRVMALPPVELRRIPTSILVSGGINKAPVIKAIVKAGYVTHLVTDESVAQAMV